MAIKWDQGLSTGFAELDTQHKEIIQRLNELMESIAQGIGRQDLEGLLNFLDRYVLNHFQQEEATMTKYRCPAAETNRQAHTRFSRNLGIIQERFENEGASAALVIGVQKDLADWFINHIRKIDTQLYIVAKAK